MTNPYADYTAMWKACGGKQSKSHDGDSSDEEFCEKFCCKRIGVVSAADSSLDQGSFAAAQQAVKDRRIGGQLIDARYPGSASQREVEKILDDLYCKGIRCFLISNSTSQVVKTLDWARDHPEACLASPISTGCAAAIPDNVFRLSNIDIRVNNERVENIRQKAYDKRPDPGMAVGPANQGRLALIFDSNDPGFSVPTKDDIFNALSGDPNLQIVQGATPNTGSSPLVYDAAQISATLTGIDTNAFPAGFASDTYSVSIFTANDTQWFSAFNAAGGYRQTVGDASVSNKNFTLVEPLSTPDFPFDLTSVAPTIQQNAFFAGYPTINDQDDVQALLQVPIGVECVYFLRTCKGASSPVGLTGGWSFDVNGDRTYRLHAIFQYTQAPNTTVGKWKVLTMFNSDPNIVC